MDVGLVDLVYRSRDLKEKIQVLTKIYKHWPRRKYRPTKY